VHTVVIRGVKISGEFCESAEPREIACGFAYVSFRARTIIEGFYNGVGNVEKYIGRVEGRDRAIVYGASFVRALFGLALGEKCAAKLRPLPAKSCTGKRKNLSNETNGDAGSPLIAVPRARSLCRSSRPHFTFLPFEKVEHP